MEEKITELILIILSLISLCVIPASALELSEEKIIFVADDTASPKFVIDSGNIFILELYFDKYANKNRKQDDEWSRLYLYNISTGKLTELTFDDKANTKGSNPIAISGNTVYWTVNRDYRSYDADIRSYDVASKSYKKLSVPPSCPNELEVQDKTIVLVSTKFRIKQLFLFLRIFLMILTVPTFAYQRMVVKTLNATDNPDIRKA